MRFIDSIQAAELPEKSDIYEMYLQSIRKTPRLVIDTKVIAL